MGISSKSDFQDWCEMHNTPEEILEKYKIYAYDNEIVPLRMESKKDLVAYYPYLTTLIAGGKIHLSCKSYIDLEEEERLTLRLEILKRYYRRCKRKKIEFNKEEALKEIAYFTVNDSDIQLVERVVELGEKATIEGIHDPMHDRMRDKWYKMMINNGWNKNEAYRWIYGWTRWLEWRKNQDDKDSEGLDGKNNNSNSKD